MKSKFRFLLAAVAGVSSIIAFGASGAAETIVEPATPLLSADVIDAAQSESEFTIIADDAVPSDDQPATPTTRPVSLSHLVMRHAAPDASSREDQCLATAVFYEAKSESLEGQLAVARTVLNRSRSGRFPVSICGVVAQPGQFSFVRSGRIPSVAPGQRNWQTAVAIAHIARNDLWSPSVGNALFFHAKRVSPGWRLKRVGAIGNHVFYR